MLDNLHGFAQRLPGLYRRAASVVFCTWIVLTGCVFGAVQQYYQVIARPMAFNLIIDRLKKHTYATAHAFENDMKLVFRNARKFNQEGSLVFQHAVQMEAVFDAAMAKTKPKLPTKAATPRRKTVPAAAPAAAVAAAVPQPVYGAPPASTGAAFMLSAAAQAQAQLRAAAALPMLHRASMPAAAAVPTAAAAAAATTGAAGAAGAAAAVEEDDPYESIWMMR